MNEQNSEKVLQTIRKLLELSNNNPNEEEAKSAALKAQELLAKYHLDIKDVEGIDADDSESIDEVGVDVPARKWKYRLANIVAKNFRCKQFLYGKSKIVFYGYHTDVAVASETFKYLFRVGDKLATKHVTDAMRMNGTSVGVYNCFVAGFCNGIDSVLSKQCVALTLVTPKEVLDSFEDRVSGFKHSKITLKINKGMSRDCMNAYENGVREGEYAMKSRQIE